MRRVWRVISLVKVRWPGLQSRRQGEGQGRRREAGSEGSPIRNCGTMNKNRIRPSSWSGPKSSSSWRRSIETDCPQSSNGILVTHASCASTSPTIMNSRTRFSFGCLSQRLRATYLMCILRPNHSVEKDRTQAALVGPLRGFAATAASHVKRWAAQK